MDVRRPDLPRFTRRRVIAGAVLLVAAIVVYTLRPLGMIRGPFMTFLVRYPVLFWAPLFASILAGGGHLGLRALLARSRPGPRRGRLLNRFGREWLPEYSFLAGGLSVLLVCAIMTSAWTQSAIAGHLRYGDLDIRTLQGGEVRVKPYEVAHRQLINSFSSPTEHATNMHVVRVDGRLRWTAFRDPTGVFRTISKPTTGIITSDAESSGPGVVVHGAAQDAEFTYGPGMRVTDNVRWQLYKHRCYTCDVTETVAVPTPDGPVIVAPYLRYEGGLFVRRPVFAGVYVVHADGTIDDLSPAEAERDPIVSTSGRMFPEALARRYADAFKYHLGVWNRFTTRTDGFEVTDTDGNRQPYLQRFAGVAHSQWVTTMTPRGRATATGGVMLTDAVTGETRFWRAPEDVALIGNDKALDIVRGERLGVNFAGAFRAVEPRQVFPDGRLHYLITVVPQEANRSTLNVIVDAAAQTVVKVFPAGETGDRALIAFLNGEEVGDAYDFDGAGGGADPNALPTPTPAAPGTPSPGPSGPAGSSTEQTLQRLLERNRRQQRELREQEADLQRLLDESG